MAEQRFIVDYGTRNLSAGIQIISRGVSESECPAVPLSLQGRGKEELPQLVGYISHEVDGSRHLQFCWGDELAKAAALRDTQVVASFGRLKLAIFGNDVESRDIKSSIEQDLARLDILERTAEDLFVRHLVAIGGAMRAATTKRYGRDLSLTMKACIFFGVPEIMDLGARQKLMSLLRRACWQQTRLVSETECAGAYHASQYLKKNKDAVFQANPLQEGDEMLVGDGGGWTLNACQYQISSTVRRDGQFGMKTTGKKESQPLGSESITLKAIRLGKRRMDAQYGSFQECLSQLGITESAFDSTVSREFESFKANGFENEGPRTIKIFGTRNGQHFRVAGIRGQANFELGPDTVRAWLDDLIGRIRDVFDRVCSPRTKMITLTGGLFRNLYVVDRLHEHYDAHGIEVVDSGRDDYGSADLAVVRGAAARFSVEAVKVPFRFSLGMFQDEYFNSCSHPEVQPGDIIRPFANEDAFVENRWKVLLPMGVLVNDRCAEIRDCWLEYLLEPGDGPITKQIFWTDQAIPAHEPLIVHGAPRADVELWQSLTFEIDADELLRLPKKWTMTKRNKRQYHGFWLYVRVRVEIHEMNVTTTWSRMPPGWNPYPRGSSTTFTAPPEDQMIPIIESSLHDSKYSSFVERREGRSSTVPSA